MFLKSGIHVMQRRSFLATGLASVIAALGSVPSVAQSVRELRIGYQKNGVLVIARQQAVLEKRFANSGIDGEMGRVFVRSADA